MQRTIPTLLSLLILGGSASGADRQLSNPEVFKGICDASAAVALSPDMFVVAADEGATLRVYRQGNPEPVAHKKLKDFLELENDDPEADLEGATWLGDRIYWIGSHGRNSDGKKRPNRRRLFATKVKIAAGEVELDPVETPYRHLLRDLKDDSRFDRFKLNKAEDLAAEDEDGLNIEGLAATPDGDLLIGFRNPVPRGQALIVRLKNPKKILEGENGKFDDPIQLDLGGRGIRSFDYWPEQRTYVIVAGPARSEGSFTVYRWSGDADSTPARIDDLDFDDLHPEATFVRDSGKKEIQILSDDGDRKLPPGVENCKDLNAAQRRFRSILLKW